MKRNLNDVRNEGISPTELNELFDRTNDQTLVERDARLRAERWPSEVERALSNLSQGLVALRARIDAMEVRLGSLPG